MNRYFNIKKLFLIIFSVVIFLSFNISVRAATAGTCEYCNDKSKLCIQLKQTKNGNYSYKYYELKDDEKIKDVIQKKIEWKKLDKKVSVTKPKREISSSCPVAWLGKKSGKYTVSFPDSIPGSGYENTYYSNAFTDSYNGIFNDRSERENGTNKGGSGESSVYGKDGSLNCYYEGGNAFFHYQLDAKGKKTYQYAFKSEGSNAKWKDVDKNVKVRYNDKNAGYSGGCPYVCIPAKVVTISETIWVNASSCPTGFGSYGSGVDPIAKINKEAGNVEGKSLDDINKSLVDPNNPNKKKKCKDLLGQELIDILQEIVDVIRIMVPILLIIFGIIDFGKAIFVSDENEMKKAQSMFIRRLIVAVSFFFIPTILKILLDIANKVWDVIPAGDDAFCGIKF